MSEASEPPIIAPDTEDFPPFYRFVFGTVQGKKQRDPVLTAGRARRVGRGSGGRTES